jgi:N-acetyl-anhydromuramyl-L-alanine amidase AmpD
MCNSFNPNSRRAFVRSTLGIGSCFLVGAAPILFTSSAVAAAPAPTIIGCDAWGARPPTEAIVMLPARPSKIIVHHTAGANSTDYSQAHAYQLARRIQQDHFKRDWIDTGQHFTISRGGYILEGRHRSLEALQRGVSHVRGAHCDGQNEAAVGIENEGTYSSEQPPQALYDQLVTLCTFICRQYGIHSSQIYGHRDFNATDCPGDQLYALLPQLRAAVAERTGDGGGNPQIWPVVKRGQTGERVKTVQYLLRTHGAGLEVDGKFGPATENAVKSFQSAHGLEPDGSVGPKTWPKLIIITRRGNTGDAVRAIQSQLVSKGHSLEIDGKFGPATESAVKRFQSANGLSADGVVGPKTWPALLQ